MDEISQFIAQEIRGRGTRFDNVVASNAKLGERLASLEASVSHLRETCASRPSTCLARAEALRGSKGSEQPAKPGVRPLNMPPEFWKGFWQFMIFAGGLLGGYFVRTTVVS